MQFDRPIGSFQAIKHLLRRHARRAPRWRAPRSTRRGAHLDEPERADASAGVVHGAKVVAGEAAIANGKTATQVFGGMGFTWEVDVHLYLKRAWVLDTHFGSADPHADRIAAALTAP